MGYGGSTGWSLYQQPYDLVILDANLPYLNGVELCRHVWAGWHRVLMLTALDSLADKEASFEAGADDYLAKPFAILLQILLHRRHLPAYAFP